MSRPPFSLKTKITTIFSMKNKRKYFKVLFAGVTISTLSGKANGYT